MKEQGSALLITMVLIAVIGSLAFGVGRITLSSFSQVTRLEDSLNARAAANAGIEDGLLRFRFDKDIELPNPQSVASGSQCVISPTRDSVYFDRINLSQSGTNSGAESSLNCINPEQEPPPPPEAIAYDIKISHKLKPGVAEEVQTTLSPRSPLPIPALSRDQAIEYDVSDLSAPITLEWQMSGAVDSRDALEIIPLAADGRVIASGKDLQFRPPGGGTQTKTIPTLGVETLRLRPFNKNLELYSLKPAANESMSSRLTTVEVIGYFGQSKRRLRLTLDRISGSILELYDFVLFAGEGEIIGPGGQ